MGHNFYNLTMTTLTGDSLDQLELAVSMLWCTVCTFFVFLMQAGFAMLEAGSVRQKNVQSQLVKNILDTCFVTICFFLLGYGFAYGTSSGNFIGTNLFAADQYGNTDLYVLFIFHWSFVSTATTIVSGSLAERTHILGYLLMAILVSSKSFIC